MALIQRRQLGGRPHWIAGLYSHQCGSDERSISRFDRFCCRSAVIVQQGTHDTADFQRSLGIFTISTSDPDAAAREQGAAFLPKFDSNGLLTGVVTHAGTGEVLMIAFMDREAVEKTRETGLAHFHSRSRGRLWMKGESSGHVLKVQEILVDCDQDALVMRCLPAGPACHTGAPSCFYRRLTEDALVRIDDKG